MMQERVAGTIRVGADIGGTFTDITLLDGQGKLHISKVLTTHHAPEQAALQGLQQVAPAASVDLRHIDTVIHGTTLVINALIERRGVKTAPLCTEGFRDTLDIAQANRFDIYDLLIERPQPLVPPALRYALPERIYSDGSVVVPLQEQAVRALIPELRRQQVQAVAVCLLHSYKNPLHERLVADILRQEAADLYLTLSSDLVPEIREYPRTSTTVANVYVRPVIEQYLRSLEKQLRQLGCPGQLLIMLSNGGTCTVETACQYPIYILESGPAAGALAAVHYGQQATFEALLSFDMGGTTAKACLIEGSKPLTTTEYEVARVYRFKKGSGLPIKVPVIEMIEIGAGGGSIARADALGLLKVGPDSAESHPGPVCYGLGGTAPTVTDADLVLGYLDAPGYPTFANGEYVNSLTCDGWEKPLTIQARVIVHDDELEVDFSGTSPEVPYGVNVVLNYTIAYTTYALKAGICPEVPNNEGSFRPVRIHAPEGSILNCRRPAPVAARHIVGHFAPECVLGALSPVLQERALAEGANTIWNIQAAGYWPSGEPFRFVSMLAGGMGARAQKDGLSAAIFPSGIRGTPVEIVETASPLVFLSKTLRCDSGGPGRFRGGLGQEVHLRVRSSQPLVFTAMFDRTQFPARGLHGGKAGACGEVLLDDGTPLAPKGKHVIPAQRVLILRLPGGGGYGSPCERDPQCVLEDVRNGFISHQQAEAVYGVIIDAQHWTIDFAATTRCRTQPPCG